MNPPVSSDSHTTESPRSSSPFEELEPDPSNPANPSSVSGSSISVPRRPVRTLSQAVLWMALPVLGEQLLTSFVGIYDTYLAGRISTDATAAVGLGSYVGWLAGNLFMLVGTGTTALVSRLHGGGQDGEANAIANQSMTLAALGGLILLPMFYLLAPWFAAGQNMEGATYATVVEFLRLDAIGLAFQGLTLAGSASLRGFGDVRTPLLILARVDILNVLLSTLLTFGLGPIPPLGVRGIVIGTVIARATGGLMTLNVLLRGRSGVHLQPVLLRPVGDRVRRILRIGLPALADGLIMWTGQFAFIGIIARLADGALQQAYYAAHMIAMRLEAFTYLPAVAWGVASANLVGQALGSGERDRARRVAHVAVLQCGLIALCVAATFVFLGRPILLGMQKDPHVAEVGAGPLRVLAMFQPLLVVGIVYVSALRGAGDTRTPMFYSLAGVLLIRLPLAYLCGIVLEGGLLGAWVGMCGDMTARGIFGFVRYSRGGWVKTTV